MTFSADLLYTDQPIMKRSVTLNHKHATIRPQLKCKNVP